MRIYKHMEARFLDALLQRGALRVGTLADYRRREHKENVRDEGEGHDYAVGGNETLSGGDTFTAPPNRRDPAHPQPLPGSSGGVWHSRIDVNTGAGAVFIGTPREDVVTTGDATARIHTSARISIENALVFCVSDTPDISVAAGYDACVEFENHFQFFGLMTSALHKHPSGAAGTPLGWDTVTYESRAHYGGAVATSAAPWRRKPPRFAWQREVRGAWELLDERLFLDIEMPGLGSLCRVIRRPA